MKALWNRTRSRSRRGSEIQPPKSENIPPLPQPPRLNQPTQRAVGNIPPNRGVRPVLVNVTRKGEAPMPMRPGTAGSLQNAVSHAADKTSQEFVRGHTRTKSPRYVDIFSVSNPSGTPSMTTSYNEEIAERNLDTRVARGEQYIGYLPASKFQEEVALRNSYQSSDPPRSSHDRQHRSWISSGTESGPSKDNTPHTSWFRENSRPNSHIPPVANPQPLPPIYDDQRSLSTNAASANSPLANYNLSKAEMSQPRPIEQSQQSVRSSSRMSSNSQNVINLQHRTIMDLTADDETGPAELDAKTSRELRPSHVQTADISPPSVSRRSTGTATGTEISPSTAPEYTPITPSSADHIVSQTDYSKVFSIPKSESTFSIINTVASYSPTTKKGPDVEPPVRDEVSSNGLESPRLAKNRLSVVPELGHTDDLQDNIGKSEPSVIESTTTNIDQSVQHSATPASTAEKATTRLTPLQSSGHIHNSPESLQSLDYINPSAAFGVRARDFAVTPSKLSLRADHGANTSAKVRNTTSGEPDSVPATNGAASPYTFDEDAFKAKQERARAAMVKLQQSLNEDFATPPRAQSAPRPNRMNGVGQRRVPAAWNANDPHGPVAPSSVFSQSNGVDDDRGRMRPAPSQTRPKVTEHASSSASSVTIRAFGRGSLRPATGSRAPTSDQVKGKGKAKESDIHVALFDLQRAAEQITGPPRVSSIPSHPPRSPLRERKGPNNQLFGYGFGQHDPTTSIGQKAQTPTSPGEVSLSNFPLAPDPTSQRESLVRNRGYINQGSSRPGSSAGARANGGYGGDPFTDQAPGPTIKRRGSTTSQASHLTSTSQYSIPFHMIPERGSSMRDSLVRELDGGD